MTTFRLCMFEYHRNHDLFSLFHPIKCHPSLISSKLVMLTFPLSVDNKCIVRRHFELCKYPAALQTCNLVIYYLLLVVWAHSTFKKIYLRYYPLLPLFILMLSLPLLRPGWTLYIWFLCLFVLSPSSWSTFSLVGITICCRLVLSLPQT